MVWKIAPKKQEEPKIEAPDNSDLDAEEARIREELKKLENKKSASKEKPVQQMYEPQEKSVEPEISKEEVYDMIQGNFNRGLYLLDVYRRM